jgi:hypothetical protein
MLGCSEHASAPMADIPTVGSPEADSESGGESVAVDSGTPARADVDGANVIAVALVIASGGAIEEALLDGEFTLAEVEAAVEAIETGTLGRYAE